MEVFFPSEIARLVLGYLKEVSCPESWQTFLEESNDLKEYNHLHKEGKFHNVCATNVHGKSLTDILAEYCKLKRAENADNQNSSTNEYEIYGVHKTPNKVNENSYNRFRINQKIQTQSVISTNYAHIQSPVQRCNFRSPTSRRSCQTPRRRLGCHVTQLNFGPDVESVSASVSHVEITNKDSTALSAIQTCNRNLVSNCSSEYNISLSPKIQYKSSKEFSDVNDKSCSVIGLKNIHTRHVPSDLPETSQRNVIPETNASEIETRQINYNSTSTEDTVNSHHNICTSELNSVLVPDNQNLQGEESCNSEKQNSSILSKSVRHKISETTFNIENITVDTLESCATPQYISDPPPYNRAPLTDSPRIILSHDRSLIPSLTTPMKDKRPWAEEEWSPKRKGSIPRRRLVSESPLSKCMQQPETILTFDTVFENLFGPEEVLFQDPLVQLLTENINKVKKNEFKQSESDVLDGALDDIVKNATELIQENPAFEEYLSSICINRDNIDSDFAAEPHTLENAGDSEIENKSLSVNKIDEDKACDKNLIDIPSQEKHGNNIDTSESDFQANVTTEELVNTNSIMSSTSENAPKDISSNAEIPSNSSIDSSHNNHDISSSSQKTINSSNVTEENNPVTNNSSKHKNDSFEVEHNKIHDNLAIHSPSVDNNDKNLLSTESLCNIDAVSSDKSNTNYVNKSMEADGVDVAKEVNSLNDIQSDNNDKSEGIQNPTANDMKSIPTQVDNSTTPQAPTTIITSQLSNQPNVILKVPLPSVPTFLLPNFITNGTSRNTIYRIIIPPTGMCMPLPTVPTPNNSSSVVINPAPVVVPPNGNFLSVGAGSNSVIINPSPVAPLLNGNVSIGASSSSGVINSPVAPQTNGNLSVGAGSSSVAINPSPAAPLLNGNLLVGAGSSSVIINSPPAAQLPNRNLSAGATLSKNIGNIVITPNKNESQKSSLSKSSGTYCPSEKTIPKNPRDCKRKTVERTEKKGISKKNKEDTQDCESSSRPSRKCKRQAKRKIRRLFPDSPLKENYDTPIKNSEDIPVLSIPEVSNHPKQTSALKLFSQITGQIEMDDKSPILKTVFSNAAVLSKKSPRLSSAHVRCLDFNLNSNDQNRNNELNTKKDKIEVVKGTPVQTRYSPLQCKEKAKTVCKSQVSDLENGQQQIRKSIESTSGNSSLTDNEINSFSEKESLDKLNASIFSKTLDICNMIEEDSQAFKDDKITDLEKNAIEGKNSTAAPEIASNNILSNEMSTFQNISDKNSNIEIIELPDSNTSLNEDEDSDLPDLCDYFSKKSKTGSEIDNSKCSIIQQNMESSKKKKKDRKRKASQANNTQTLSVSEHNSHTKPIAKRKENQKISQICNSQIDENLEPDSMIISSRTKKNEMSTSQVSDSQMISSLEQTANIEKGKENDKERFPMVDFQTVPTVESNSSGEVVKDGNKAENHCSNSQTVAIEKCDLNIKSNENVSKNMTEFVNSELRDKDLTKQTTVQSKAACSAEKDYQKCSNHSNNESISNLHTMVPENSKTEGKKSSVVETTVCASPEKLKKCEMSGSQSLSLLLFGSDSLDDDSGSKSSDSIYQTSNNEISVCDALSGKSIDKCNTKVNISGVNQSSPSMQFRDEQDGILNSVGSSLKDNNKTLTLSPQNQNSFVSSFNISNTVKQNGEGEKNLTESNNETKSDSSDSLIKKITNDSSVSAEKMINLNNSSVIQDTNINKNVKKNVCKNSKTERKSLESVVSFCTEKVKQGNSRNINDPLSASDFSNAKNINKDTPKANSHQFDTKNSLANDNDSKTVDKPKGISRHSLIKDFNVDGNNVNKLLQSSTPKQSSKIQKPVDICPSRTVSPLMQNKNFSALQQQNSKTVKQNTDSVAKENLSDLKYNATITKSSPCYGNRTKSQLSSRVNITSDSDKPHSSVSVSPPTSSNKNDDFNIRTSMSMGKSEELLNKNNSVTLRALNNENKVMPPKKRIRPIPVDSSSNESFSAFMNFLPTQSVRSTNKMNAESRIGNAVETENSKTTEVSISKILPECTNINSVPETSVLNKESNSLIVNSSPLHTDPSTPLKYFKVTPGFKSSKINSESGIRNAIETKNSKTTEVSISKVLPECINVNSVPETSVLNKESNSLIVNSSSLHSNTLSPLKHFKVVPKFKSPISKIQASLSPVFKPVSQSSYWKSGKPRAMAAFYKNAFPNKVSELPISPVSFSNSSYSCTGDAFPAKRKLLNDEANSPNKDEQSNAVDIEESCNLNKDICKRNRHPAQEECCKRSNKPISKEKIIKETHKSSKNKFCDYLEKTEEISSINSTCKEAFESENLSLYKKKKRSDSCNSDTCSTIILLSDEEIMTPIKSDDWLNRDVFCKEVTPPRERKRKSNLLYSSSEEISESSPEKDTGLKKKKEPEISTVVKMPSKQVFSKNKNFYRSRKPIYKYEKRKNENISIKTKQRRSRPTLKIASPKKKKFDDKCSVPQDIYTKKTMKNNATPKNSLSKNNQQSLLCLESVSEDGVSTEEDLIFNCNEKNKLLTYSKPQNNGIIQSQKKKEISQENLDNLRCQTDNDLMQLDPKQPAKNIDQCESTRDIVESDIGRSNEKGSELAIAIASCEKELGNYQADNNSQSSLHEVNGGFQSIILEKLKTMCQDEKTTEMLDSSSKSMTENLKMKFILEKINTLGMDEILNRLTEKE